MTLLANPPHYRPADTRKQRCGTCGAFTCYIWCRMYVRPVDAGRVCDRWYRR